MITKQRRIHVRATPLQAAAWRLAAEESGLSFSEWMRRCAERELAGRYQTQIAPAMQPRAAA